MVVEHRAVDRAGNVILAVLAFGANVDHLVKLVELCYGNRERAARSHARVGLLSFSTFRDLANVFISEFTVNA